MYKVLLSTYRTNRADLEHYGVVTYESKLDVDGCKATFVMETDFTPIALQEILRYQTEDHEIVVNEEVIGRLPSENHKFSMEYVEDFPFSTAEPIIQKVSGISYKHNPDKVFPLVTQREKEYQTALMKIDKLLDEAKNPANFMDFGYEYISEIKTIVDELNLQERKK